MQRRLAAAPLSSGVVSFSSEINDFKSSSIVRFLNIKQRSYWQEKANLTLSACMADFYIGKLSSIVTLDRSHKVGH